MEIYKLSDEINSDSNELKKHKITDLKQGVKNPNRVNVFVDGKYDFSLDIAQVVDLAVKIGKEVSEEELADLKKASEFGKTYQRALEWVLMQPRSERELRDYLKRREKTAEMKERQKEWQAEKEGRKVRKNARVRAKYDFDDLIVERLMEKGYVDDKKFAEHYVENRFVKKGISRKRLEMELMKKGVERGIIDEVVGGRDDEEEIKKIIARKSRMYDEEKLINYLCRQGFSPELVRSLVLECEKD